MFCEVSDCERATVARGRCRRHWRQLRISEGYMEPPRLDRRVSGTCRECGEAFTVSTAGQERADDICPGCWRTSINRRLASEQAAKAALLRANRPPAPLVVKVCRECGADFTGTRRFYCSLACSQEATAAKRGYRFRDCKGCGASLGRYSTKDFCETCRVSKLRDNRRRAKASGRKRGATWVADRNHRQRARRYGVAYEPIRKADVFARDGWVCGICGDPVDPGLKFPDVMSVSLDHVVPMVRGGGHVWGNVQCSHFLCNSVKSDRLEVANV